MNAALGPASCPFGSRSLVVGRNMEEAPAGQRTFRCIMAVVRESEMVSGMGSWTLSTPLVPRFVLGLLVLLFVCWLPLPVAAAGLPERRFCWEPNT